MKKITNLLSDTLSDSDAKSLQNGDKKRRIQAKKASSIRHQIFDRPPRLKKLFMEELFSL